MIDTRQMEDRYVQVMDFKQFFNGLISPVVCIAVSDPTLNATTGSATW